MVTLTVCLPTMVATRRDQGYLAIMAMFPVRASLAGHKVPRSWTLQSDPLPFSGAAKVLKRELREREAGRRSPR